MRVCMQAPSKTDFLSKMNNALKEENMAEYRLIFLRETKYFKISELQSLNNGCREICRLFISMVKTIKNKRNT